MHVLLALGLVEAELLRAPAARTSSVHERQRSAVVASPGAARKITKLSVIATKIVANANAIRLTT